MESGKILIVRKDDGQVLGWFGENTINLSDVELIQLEPNQNSDNFIDTPVENIKVVDKKNKILAFEKIL